MSSPERQPAAIDRLRQHAKRVHEIIDFVANQIDELMSGGENADANAVRRGIHFVQILLTAARSDAHESADTDTSALLDTLSQTITEELSAIGVPTIPDELALDDEGLLAVREAMTAVLAMRGMSTTASGQWFEHSDAATERTQIVAMRMNVDPAIPEEKAA